MSLQFITPYSVRIGVAGAGVMGSGIALTILLADLPVTLYDVSPQILGRAREYIEDHLVHKNKGHNLSILTLSRQLEDLSGVGIVIEAIPEDLGLKQDLFRQLDSLCPPPAVLATNTSTLAITAIAAATSHAERVAGMHFFNPAPVMPLVELVHGAQTSRDTIQILQALSGKLGKTSVVAADTPGFIVNRVARPFYGEALRLLRDRVASHDQIDLIVRLGGGFRMGPFQLMDLIGIDVNLAAMQSMYEQAFEEPRYQPLPLQVRMVQQNALGRKTGRGFYRYSGDVGSPVGPTPPEPHAVGGLVTLSPGSWAAGLGEIVRRVGYSLKSNTANLALTPMIALVPASRREGLKRLLEELDNRLPQHVPILCQCADVTLTEAATWIEKPERLVGFDGLFFAQGRAATLVASPTLTPQIHTLVENFVTSLGYLPIWVEDTPGLVLPRIVSMLVNEAAFTVQEAHAEADQIDLAMRLGANYPRGPLAWAKEIGYTRVVDVLDHLQAEYGEDRYRPAYLLRRWARLERVSG